MINNPEKFYPCFVMLCLILIELVYLIVMVILSDEEEAEEASEEKDRDIVNSADSSRNPTPKSSAKFGAKTIDLGAAANFGKSEITSSIDSSSNVKTSSAPPLRVGNADLVDLFDLAPPGMQPLQTSATVPAQNDFFADFASAPAGGGSINGKAKVVNICTLRSSIGTKFYFSECPKCSHCHHLVCITFINHLKYHVFHLCNYIICSYYNSRWLASSTDQGPVPRSQININPGLKLTMIDIVCSNLSLLSYWVMFS